MFFEINDVIYDSNKLQDKRLVAFNLVKDAVETSCIVEELDDNIFFIEESLLVVKLDFVGVEEFFATDFSF